MQNAWNKLYNDYKDVRLKDKNTATGSAPVLLNFPYYASLGFLDKQLSRADNIQPNARNGNNDILAKLRRATKKNSNRKRKSTSETVVIPELDEFAKKKWQEKTEYQQVTSAISKIAVQASNFLSSREKQSTNLLLDSESQEYYNLIADRLKIVQNKHGNEILQTCFEEALDALLMYRLEVEKNQ